MKDNQISNNLFIIVAALLILIVLGSVFYFLEKSGVKSNILIDSTEWVKQGPIPKDTLLNEEVSSSISAAQATDFMENFMSKDVLEVPVYWYFERSQIESLLLDDSAGNQVTHLRFYSGVNDADSTNRKLTLIVLPVYANAGVLENSAMFEFSKTCPLNCPEALPANERVFVEMEQNDISGSFEFSKDAITSCFTSDQNLLRVKAHENTNGNLSLRVCGIKVQDANFENQVVGNCSNEAPSTRTVKKTNLPRFKN
jgi:hypothetical protein